VVLGLASLIVAAACLFANHVMHERDVITVKSVLEDMDDCYRHSTDSSEVDDASSFLPVWALQTLGKEASANRIYRRLLRLARQQLVAENT
jgi:hypothetical protein